MEKNKNILANPFSFENFEDRVSAKSSTQLGNDFEDACNESLVFFAPDYISQKEKQILNSHVDIHFSSKIDVSKDFEKILLSETHNNGQLQLYEVFYDDYLYNEEEIQKTREKKKIKGKFNVSEKEKTFEYLGEIKLFSGDVKDKQTENMKIEKSEKLEIPRKDEKEENKNEEEYKKKKSKKKAKVNQKMTHQIAKSLIAFDKINNRVPDYFICISN